MFFPLTPPSSFLLGAEWSVGPQRPGGRRRLGAPQPLDKEKEERRLRREGKSVPSSSLPKIFHCKQIVPFYKSYSDVTRPNKDLP